MVNCCFCIRMSLPGDGDGLGGGWEGEVMSTALKCDNNRRNAKGFRIDVLEFNLFQMRLFKLVQCL